jgi:hypothetical protein
MKEYRARTCVSAPPLVNTASSAEKWEQLDQEYGLADMFDETIVEVRGLSLEEEYGAYINGPLSPKGTSMLQFWEVSDIL